MTSGERDGDDGTYGFAHDPHDQSRDDEVPAFVEMVEPGDRRTSNDDGSTVTMRRSAILSVRDALLRGDGEAAYHALLGGVDPSFVDPEPWKAPIVDDEDEPETRPKGSLFVTIGRGGTIDGIVTRLGATASAYRDKPGGSAIAEAEKALATIVAQMRLAGCEIVYDRHEVVGVRNARAEDLEQAISRLDMRIRKDVAMFRRLAELVEPPLGEAGVWSGDIVEAVGAERTMLSDRIAHLERSGTDRPPHRGATPVDWWSERVPQDGESEEEAILRLHRSPGYGGSLEDARCAVYDAMDKARMVASASGNGA